MRTRTAVTVVATAAVLGALTGAFVLPAHDAATAAGERSVGEQSAGAPSAAIPSPPAPSPGSSAPPRSSASAATPASTPRSSRPTGDPLGKANLLTTSDFTKLGLAVTA